MPEPNILHVDALGVTFVHNEDGSVTVQLPFPFGSKQVLPGVVEQIKEWFDAQQVHKPS